MKRLFWSWIIISFCAGLWVMNLVWIFTYEEPQCRIIVVPQFVPVQPKPRIDHRTIELQTAREIFKGQMRDPFQARMK